MLIFFLTRSAAPNAEIVDREPEQTWVERRFATQELTGRKKLLNDELWLVVGKLTAAVFGNFPYQELECAVCQRKTVARGEPLKDAVEFLPGRPLHLDLVGYPPQKRPIHQVRWIKVGREDDQLLERNLDRLAGMELQKVDPVFQWNNPAVEQCRWRHDLPAEVIDQQTAAIGLDVKRRLIEFRGLIVPQIKHLQR